ncbi:MAG TPA: POTRA domain-containing protein, partial [Candidatus Competibacteraceae bacterium]|nr:POTRA domain-containing protein [Candidatus Competibacteraceae bacterium]
MIAIITLFIRCPRRLFHVGPPLVSLCLLLSAGLLYAQQMAPEPSSDPASATATKSPATETGKLTVVIDGLEDDALRNNVLAFLDINRFAGKPAPEEIRLNWLYKQAEDEIRQALQPFGYFEPTIEASLTRTDSGGWEARYRIQPGRPMRITELDVQVLGEGAQDPPFQTLLANLPLTQGQVLDQPKYEQIKSVMESLATERGYFDARFTERAIRVDLQAYTATIRLHYDTGKRYRFGNITFKQDFLSPDLLSRYPSFKP